jgi:hypothetical protein
MTAPAPAAPAPKLSADAQIKATEKAIKDHITDLLNAMGAIQNESDRWELADQLAQIVPNGSFGFERIIDAATQANVVGAFSATTLRLYRDTSKNWPDDMRVKGVSFSAHREAERMPTMIEAKKVLDDVLKTKGNPQSVSVQAVRQAVKVRKGVAPTAAPSQPTTPAVPGGHSAVTLSEVLTDIKGGSTKLINAIPNTTTLAELDKLQAGLKKLAEHIDRLRATANRKAQAAAAQKGTAKVDTKAEVAAQAAAVAAKPAEAGDIRGL